MAGPWRETNLWRETGAVPATLARTLDDSANIGAAAQLLQPLMCGELSPRATGASPRAATALWLASLDGRRGPDLLVVPAGLLARGAFAAER